MYSFAVGIKPVFFGIVVALVTKCECQFLKIPFGEPHFESQFFKHFEIFIYLENQLLVESITL